MKKKLFVGFSLLLCLVLSISLIACSDKKHEGKSEWSSDENKHWHECTTEGHEDKLDEAEHVWNDGEVTTAPTEIDYGVKTYTCTVCGKQKTETVAKVAHTHKFDTSKWEKDENKHWHKATCGHEVRKDEGAHSYSGWSTKTAESYGTDRVEKRTCSVCSFEQTRTVKDTALEAKENTVSINDGVKTSKTYDKQAIALSAENFTANGDGAITFTYRVKGSEEEFSEVSPVNAGAYEVKVSVAATAEWKACETTVEYTIEQYELTEVYGKTHTKEYSGTFGISVEVNPFDGEEVSVTIAMRKADAGTKEIGRVWVVGVTNSNNYTIDQSKVKAEIVPKKLNGLKFTVNLGDIDEEGGETDIEREINGVNGEKLTVIITFNQSELCNEEGLELSIDGSMGATCKIRLKDPNPNYEFAGDIGSLDLIRYTFD